jgi:DNA-binding transcriptional regulator YiaG
LYGAAPPIDSIDRPPRKIYSRKWILGLIIYRDKSIIQLAMTSSTQIESRLQAKAPLVFRPEAIREFLAASGLETRDFAKVAGVTQQAVSFWVRGCTCPSVPSLVMLCNAFGVEVGHFFRRDAEAAPGVLTERPRAMRDVG